MHTLVSNPEVNENTTSLFVRVCVLQDGGVGVCVGGGVRL